MKFGRLSLLISLLLSLLLFVSPSLSQKGEEKPHHSHHGDGVESGGGDDEWSVGSEDGEDSPVDYDDEDEEDEDEQVFASLDADELAEEEDESFDELLPLADIYENKAVKTPLGTLKPISFFRQFVHKSQPLLIHSIPPNWVAFQNWTSDDYLKSKVQNSPISILGSEIYPFDWFQKKITTTPSTFDQFLSKYQTEALHLIVQDLPNQLPSLASDLLPNLELFDVFQVEKGKIFFHFGSSKRLDSLHFDSYERFIIPISGKLTINIFPPTGTKYLYPTPTPTPTSPSPSTVFVSPINFTNPQWELFPLFVGRTPFGFNLQAGEMIYLPSHWFHSVKFHSRTIFLEILYPSASTITELFYTEYGKRLEEVERKKEEEEKKNQKEKDQRKEAQIIQ